MSSLRTFWLIPVAFTLGSFAIQTAPAEAVYFTPTTYNLVNGLNSAVPYASVVAGLEAYGPLQGVITTYPNGPQEYLGIVVNPNIDAGTPSPTLDAPYGLTKLVGSVYLYDLWTPDANNPGKYIYQSSVANTNPYSFSALASYPGLPSGSLILEGSGPNKVFGSEVANITQENIGGVIHITSIGTITITGGEGMFAGATGTLTFLEKGISGLPYVGTTTISGTINTVPEPSTIIGSLAALGLGAGWERKLRKKK